VEAFAGVAHLPTGFNEHATAAVRALIAQARATDQARVAELAAPTDWAGDLARALNRAEAAGAEVAALRAENARLDTALNDITDTAMRDRATVERVRALRRRWMQEVHNTPATAAIHQCARDLRAALADPKGDA